MDIQSIRVDGTVYTWTSQHIVGNAESAGSLGWPVCDDSVVAEGGSLQRDRSACISIKIKSNASLGLSGFFDVQGQLHLGSWRDNWLMFNCSPDQTFSSKDDRATGPVISIEPGDNP